MLKIILPIVVALITSSAYATGIKTSTTIGLTEQEIQLAIELVNKYEVPLEVSGSCTATIFSVSSWVRGYNPAKWTLSNLEGEASTLNNDEISELISLYDRVKPALLRVDSITNVQKVYIQCASCGFSPNKWTVTFN